MSAVLYKASRIVTDEPVPDLLLDATVEAPRPSPLGDPEFTAKARAFYREQGKIIADALFASLPGGTIDALLVEMLDRKASILRVLLPEAPKEDKTDRPMSTHFEGDREVCNACGESWDRKSTQAIYGHDCPKDELWTEVLRLDVENNGSPPSLDEWKNLVKLARELGESS